MSKISRISYNCNELKLFSVATRDIYTENLRQAAASDTYVLNGHPTGETYEPTYVCFSIIHED